jgi:hypothetical protein
MTPDDLQKAADKLDLNITFVEKVLEQGQILNHIKKAEKQA